jgi:hypothetical protein
MLASSEQAWDQWHPRVQNSVEKRTMPSANTPVMLFPPGESGVEAGRKPKSSNPAPVAVDDPAADPSKSPWQFRTGLIAGVTFRYPFFNTACLFCESGAPPSSAAN